LLHQKNYVHGDIKPANICIRKREAHELQSRPQDPAAAYKSEYEFTLIDFGIISQFKIKKARRVNEFVTGNLRYCPLRSLQLIQNRF
jgi:predicted unusual protein kinase regulating ubiquinone biosynthesis (AarF/ABC1/UbiB family)